MEWTTLNNTDPPFARVVDNVDEWIWFRWGQLTEGCHTSKEPNCYLPINFILLLLVFFHRLPPRQAQSHNPRTMNILVSGHFERCTLR